MNSRGDVEALYDSAATLKARYGYDSWGQVVSVQDSAGSEITDAGHIGLINPIRYRGYYYDAESGFYYLEKRYYDTEIGRFLNLDSYISTGQGFLGNNMFVYCNNNPVNMADVTGEVPDYILLENARRYEQGGNILMCGYKNNKPKESSNKVTYSSDSLKVCTDGIGSSHNDIYHQNSTAYMGGTINADVHKYIVIPTDHPDYRELLGCVGVVIDNSTGQYQYCIVGEGGPKGKYGEVSICVVWDFGYSSDGSYGPEGSFDFILFPGTKRKWDADNLQLQIEKIGRAYYPW